MTGADENNIQKIMDMCVFIWICCFISKVYGDGVLVIEFKDYNNPGGNGNNGHCCDGRSIFCESQGGCDHFFQGCVSKFYDEEPDDASPSSTSHCSLGTFTTGVTHDQKQITFTDSIGGTPNPLEVPFSSWETPGVYLKVVAWDSDSGNGHDLVDILRKRISVEPKRTEQQATMLDVTISARTTLRIRIKAYCEDDFYGPECAVYCVSQNSWRGHYTCHHTTGSKICHAGWSGLNCATNTNECASSPCQHQATCQDQVNGYLCNCKPGYTGRHCETQLNFCESSPCQNQGSCQPYVNGYNCACTVDYTGVHCEEEINQCDSDPCQHGGRCQDGVGTFTCHCADGWTGDVCVININECQSSPCAHNGTCTDGDNRYTCNCVLGYGGDHCEEDIDECASSPCHGEMSRCIDGVAGYQCECPEGMTGVHCELDIDECSSSPCGNNGTCMDQLNGYVCNCSLGWEGDNCEVNIDDCTPDTCENNQTCWDQTNGYLCNCSLAWTGVHCENDTDECIMDICQNNATCNNSWGSYECFCSEGWTGENCDIEIDECESSPCSNNATCIDLLCAFTCSCAEGFNGTLCEEDIDECSIWEPCSGNHTCTNTYGSFLCTCPRGYEGEHCDEETDECVSQPCLNGGNCTDLPAAYNCSCTSNYTGANCEIYDICWMNQCEGAATCRMNDTQVVCTCPSGLTGQYCQDDIDECVNTTCQNGGTCINTYMSYYCSCPQGFTGEMCDEEIKVTTEGKKDHTTTTMVDIIPTDIPGAAIIFIGKLSEVKVKDIKMAAAKVLSQLYNVSVSKISLEVTTYVCYTAEGEELTSVIFIAQVNSHSLLAEQFYEVIERMYSQGHFGESLYTGVDCYVDPKVPIEQGWLSRHWYIIVIAVIATCVTLTVLIIVIGCIRRRKSKVPSGTVHQYPNPEYVVDRRSRGSEGALQLVPEEEHQPVQVFENNVYMEIHTDDGSTV